MPIKPCFPLKMHFWGGHFLPVLRKRVKKMAVIKPGPAFPCPLGFGIQLAAGLRIRVILAGFRIQTLFDIFIRPAFLFHNCLTSFKESENNWTFDLIIQK